MQSEANFISCAKNDDNIDVSVFQGQVVKKSCGKLQLTYGLEQSDQIYTMICNTEGDLVKLSKDTGAVAAYEVVVVSGCKYKNIDKLTSNSADKGKPGNNSGLRTEREPPLRHNAAQQLTS